MNTTKAILAASLLVLAGCATEGPTPPEHHGTLAHVTWRCPSGRSFTASVGDLAIVGAGGHSYRLPHVRGASGVRYSNGAVEYWEHAGEATLHGASGGPYEHCRHG